MLNKNTDVSYKSIYNYKVTRNIEKKSAKSVEVGYVTALKPTSAEVWSHMTRGSTRAHLS
jgi:hypothetical protein